MKLTLQRKPTVLPPGAPPYTPGELSVGGLFQCYTCEDVEREVKVMGVTAIPAGRYQVVVTHSPRFQRRLPLLLSVPGFSGVRIHTGNTAGDTEGCILVGQRETFSGVGQSRPAFDRLFPQLEAALAAGDDIWLEIFSP